MNLKLVIPVNAQNIAAVMAALAPFGGAVQTVAAPLTNTAPPPPPPPGAPQAGTAPGVYPSNVGAPPPPMAAPNNPPPPPAAAPQASTAAQSVYPAMQAYAAQYRADGVLAVFTRYGVNPPGLANCTPDQLGWVKAHFESLQPANAM